VTVPPTPNRGAMIVLAYLWPLALVPLVLDKDDPEVQWHAKHGIVLMVAELGILLVLSVIASILSVAVLGVGWVMTVFGATFSLGILGVQLAIVAFHVIAIFKAIDGGRLVVPGISDFADRF
jgi:uncharacterized membrane protein